MKKEPLISLIPNQNDNILIIASFFDNHLKNVAIWSQLECLGSRFQKIIISAPNEQKNNVTDLLSEVERIMPKTFLKISTSFHVNDRYDAGLWCDGLTANVKTTVSNFESSFLLINDSLFLIRKMDYIPFILKAKEKDLISLNYWDIDGNFWVESPFRLFSKNGIKIFRENVCNLGIIKWKKHCPHLKKYIGKWHKRKLKKRCIVEKTEVEVANYFERAKVEGLFPGYVKYRYEMPGIKKPDGKTHKVWAEDFYSWKKIEKSHNFPVVKVTKKDLINTFFHGTRNHSHVCLSLLPKKYKKLHY